MLSLSSLPFPDMVESIEYEEIVTRKLSKVKEILQKKGIEYIESEADDLMTLIEMDAYEEMLLRINLNERIKQNFLAYATGSNLDHIGVTRFGVSRLEGKEPEALYEFTLSLAQDSDVILPKGMLLGDSQNIAELIDSAVIKKGETKTTAKARLKEFVKEKDIKLETILTPIPWVVEAKQLTAFINGANKEDDKRYRERIWLSRDRKTTAGSKNMYIFYTKSADVRVVDANVRNGGLGVVEICYFADEDITQIVKEYLSSEEIRPLTDKVVVQKATVKKILIEATLLAKDIEFVDTKEIKKRFERYERRFGVFLSIAKIYDLLADENIVDVELREPLSSIKTEFNEVLSFEFSLGVRDANT